MLQRSHLNNTSSSTASESISKALQSDIDAHRALPTEIKSLQKQLSSKDHELNTLNARLSELGKTLDAANSEKQALQAKLTAARNASTSLPSAPGFIAKQPTKGRDPPHLNGTSGANIQPRETAAKEDLYGDLTGLIVVGVKVIPDNPGLRVYECIQTGKNGTLHFHLTTPAQTTDEEDEITFTPLLERERDRVLISLLPDYLTEEITFSRVNATRFYLKLLGVIMRTDAPGVDGRVGAAVVPETGGEVRADGE